MPDDFNPVPTERVSRILIRPDAEAGSERPVRDEDDFLRRREYGFPKRPENGLSLFRRRKPDQFVYDRLCVQRKKRAIIYVDKFLGLTTCEFKILQNAKLKHHSTPANPEHVSLRCPGCDLADVADDEKTCSPETDGEQCPFFQLNDPFGLADLFADDIAPSLRSHSQKE